VLGNSEGWVSLEVVSELCVKVGLKCLTLRCHAVGSEKVDKVCGLYANERNV